jgi:hypothetical protein
MSSNNVGSTCSHVTKAVFSQKETKEEFLRWGFVTWPLLQWQLFLTVKTCSCLQPSRFGVALTVLSKGLPAGGPATARIAKRLECSSAVSSSKLSDTAHSQAEQADRKNCLLTVGKHWFTVNWNLIFVSDNYINKVNMLQQIMFFFRPDSVIDSITATAALNMG